MRMYGGVAYSTIRETNRDAYVRIWFACETNGEVESVIVMTLMELNRVSSPN